MILTIEIDGEWTARELAEFLDSLEALAGYFLDGKILRLGLQPLKVTNGNGTATLQFDYPLPSHLRLIRFTYASPGSFDLLGAAKIVEQIRLFLEFIINLWITRNDRRLDQEERNVELAQRKLELIKEIEGVQPGAVKFIKDQAVDSILGAVIQGKVTSVSARQSEDD